MYPVNEQLFNLSIENQRFNDVINNIKSEHLQSFCRYITTSSYLWINKRGYIVYKKVKDCGVKSFTVNNIDILIVTELDDLGCKYYIYRIVLNCCFSKVSDIHKINIINNSVDIIEINIYEDSAVVISTNVIPTYNGESPIQTIEKLFIESPIDNLLPPISLTTSHY